MLHNLYKKPASQTGTLESQQAMAIFKAGKLDCINDSKQNLISSLNRGGLWSITELCNGRTLLPPATCTGSSKSGFTRNRHCYNNY